MPFTGAQVDALEYSCNGCRSHVLIRIFIKYSHHSLLMNTETWDNVDSFIAKHLIKQDDILENALKTTKEGNLPEINVTATQGKMLYILARLVSARRILEIGTLGAYSTIWMARALPDNGKLITLEIDIHHAQVASGNLKFAGVREKVSILTGPALQSLSELHAKGTESFDLIFIDADKPGNPEYLEWALRLSHPGTIIIVDNVVRGGSIIDPKNRGPGGEGVIRMFDNILNSEHMTGTAIQTVSSKGYDGFAMILVN